MEAINVVGKKKTRNTGKMANSYLFHFHFEAEFSGKDKLVCVDETYQIGSGKQNKKRRANCYIKLGTLVCNVIRMV